MREEIFSSAAILGGAISFSESVYISFRAITFFLLESLYPTQNIIEVKYMNFWREFVPVMLFGVALGVIACAHFLRIMSAMQKRKKGTPAERSITVIIYRGDQEICRKTFPLTNPLSSHTHADELGRSGRL